MICSQQDNRITRSNMTLDNQPITLLFYKSDHSLHCFFLGFFCLAAKSRPSSDSSTKFRRPTVLSPAPWRKHQCPTKRAPRQTKADPEVTDKTYCCKEFVEQTQMPCRSFAKTTIKFIWNSIFTALPWGQVALLAAPSGDKCFKRVRVDVTTNKLVLQQAVYNMTGECVSPWSIKSIMCVCVCVCVCCHK